MADGVVAGGEVLIDLLAVFFILFRQRPAPKASYSSMLASVSCRLAAFFFRVLGGGQGVPGGEKLLYRLVVLGQIAFGHRHQVVGQIYPLVEVVLDTQAVPSTPL